MTITEMLEQSAILTVLGMTVVFIFLWLMIICVNLVGKVIRTMLDKDAASPPPPRNDSPRRGARRTAGYRRSVRYGFYEGLIPPQTYTMADLNMPQRLPRRKAGSWVLDPTANKGVSPEVPPAIAPVIVKFRKE
jgi:sodium pump decarboxylase gamma subunit